MKLPTKWKTKEGKILSIKKMETSHINNCIRILERNGFVSVQTLSFYLYGPKPIGDMAQLAYEQECNEIFELQPTPYLDAFEKELKRRNV